jgi:hypothetical protein
MGWAGGTYTKGNNSTGGWTGDASLGIGIEAGRHDTQDNDFATGINQCLNKDGSNAATADLPMGGFKHTNVANATGRTNYAAVGQVQDGDFIWLGTTAGTATAMTASATPAITAYKAGQKFKMITASGSTGSTATAHTLAINGLASPKNIVNNEDSTNPTLGTWVSGALIELIYDGTNFRITNDSGGWLTYTPTIATTSGGSISSVVATRAKYRKRGKSIELSLYITFNTTGVGATITCTIPVNSNYGGANHSINPYRSVLAATNGIGLAINEASNTIYTLLVNAAVGAWGTSANAVNINFSYESV